MTPELSLVIPLYNEERSIGLLWQRLWAVLSSLDLHFEVLFINDGSTDTTLDILRRLAADEPRIKVVDLSRNFGKEAALTCGFTHACGQAVVAMDGDLQHPPEVLPELLARWRQGAEMVYGVRRDRISQGLWDRWSTRLFYWVFERCAEVSLPRDAGDFRLLDRKVVNALNDLPERSRFMKGIFAWLGFRSVGVEFSVQDRVHGGSKFSVLRKISFAADALTSFSRVPLRVWGLVGAAVSLLAFFYIIVRLFRVLIQGIDVPGYESILAAVLFLGGMQLLSLGIIGDYLGRVFEETKHRPLYVVRETFGIDTDVSRPI
jgi:glycosyltransferase involved in cell wall biosynthesis